MDILWKGLIGGAVTAVIAWSAKRGNTLPGVIPLFPTFALIALYIIGLKGDQDGFRQACFAGMKSLPAYLAFVGISYLTIAKLDFRIALLFGLGAWFLVESAMFIIPRWP